MFARKNNRYLLMILYPTKALPKNKLTYFHHLFMLPASAFILIYLVILAFYSAVSPKWTALDCPLIFGHKLS